MEQDWRASDRDENRNDGEDGGVDAQEASGENTRMGGIGRISEVNILMRAMDSVYKTKFSEWIRSVDNIDYIVCNLRKLPHEPEQWYVRFGEGVVWITEEWEPCDIAALLHRVMRGARGKGSEGTYSSAGVRPWPELDRVLVLRCILKLMRECDIRYQSGEQMDHGGQGAKVLGSYFSDYTSAEAADSLLKITFDWDIDQSITYLKGIVCETGWDKQKLRSFIECYTSVLKANIVQDRKKTLSSVQAIQDTRMNIAELKLSIAKYNLAIANFNLTIANYNLQSASRKLKPTEQLEGQKRHGDNSIDEEMLSSNVVRAEGSDTICCSGLGTLGRVDAEVDPNNISLHSSSSSLSLIYDVPTCTYKQQLERQDVESSSRMTETGHSNVTATLDITRRVIVPTCCLSETSDWSECRRTGGAPQNAGMQRNLPPDSPQMVGMERIDSSVANPPKDDYKESALTTNVSHETSSPHLSQPTAVINETSCELAKNDNSSDKNMSVRLRTDVLSRSQARSASTSNRFRTALEPVTSSEKTNIQGSRRPESLMMSTSASAASPGEGNPRTVYAGARPYPPRARSSSDSSAAVVDDGHVSHKKGVVVHNNHYSHSDLKEKVECTGVSGPNERDIDIGNSSSAVDHRHELGSSRPPTTCTCSSTSRSIHASTTSMACTSLYCSTDVMSTPCLSKTAETLCRHGHLPLFRVGANDALITTGRMLPTNLHFPESMVASTPILAHAPNICPDDEHVIDYNPQQTYRVRTGPTCRREELCVASASAEPLQGPSCRTTSEAGASADISDHELQHMYSK
eukprot:Nk52_evm42s1485 gene=Nk52_evmTU42s1485